MTTLHERIETPLPLQDTFDFIADFSNAAHWDPGVATATRLDDGPLGDGRPGSTSASGWAAGCRQMEYVITTWQPPQRVVLTGSGSGVAADRRHSVRGDRGRHAWSTTPPTSGCAALLRLVAPFAGGAFARIARDARDGMQRALDERATAG